MTNEMREYFGEPIYSYTDQQAIDDGVLVYPFPDKFPGVLLTSAVHHAIDASDDGRDYAQKAIPLLMDAVMIVNNGDREERLFTKGLEGNVTGQDLWIGRNGMAGFTIMFPSDY